MNYNNSDTRLRPTASTARPGPAEETVLSLERDARGVHLRVRRVTTLARRVLRTPPALRTPLAA